MHAHRLPGLGELALKQNKKVDYKLLVNCLDSHRFFKKMLSCGRILFGGLQKCFILKSIKNEPGFIGGI